MQPMEEVYRRYAQTVYKYILSLTHDSNVAEELTQETFYQAIRSSESFDESCKVSTWLCGIAKNALRTYRRKHPEQDGLESISAFAESAEKDALSAMERVALFQKLHDLKEPYREVFYLRIFGGLSFKEIGEILRKSENWARVTFYRGRENLRKEVHNDE